MDSQHSPHGPIAAGPRIIIGLIEHMGDIVACEPVARYLRYNHPQAHIAWAVTAPYRELIDSNPFIDETVVIGCLTEWMVIANHAAYDQVVDLHVNYRICGHCQVPLTKRSGNPFISVFEYFDYGALLEAFSVGAGLPRLSAQPRVYLGQEHARAVDALALPEAYCVIHRSSNDPRKDWTAAGWQQIAATLRGRLGLAIVEVGAGAVQSLPPPIEGVIDLVNRLPVMQTAEVIRRATLFVGIDSGPSHFANALQVPGVILLGRYGNFRKYQPYTGFYAQATPLVRLVRNLLGVVADIDVQDVDDAVRYVAGAARTMARQPADGGGSAASILPWHMPREPRSRDLENSGLFDTGWYAVHYPQVCHSTWHPIDHYLKWGAREGLNPGPRFNGQAYQDADPEIRRRGMNPLLHYIDAGWSDGRAVPAPDRGPGGPPGEGTAAWSRSIAALFEEPQPHSLALPPPPRDLAMPRLFAFYLPQFHPIPENDAAHGPGFSEWHNVIKARPLFAGHYQPRVPGELGYYDLRSEEVLHQQIKLAQSHGIEGFCFYYYYFQGKKLLFKPLANFLKSDIDAPFMCLWANENWTRRWDGGDSEVIISQHHSDEDDLLALEELVTLFRDPRYVKISGKPVLMIYKTHLFPNIARTAELWRQEIVRLGFPDLFLVMVDDWTADPPHPRDLGFDASYEIPSNIIPASVHKDGAEQLGLAEGFTGRIVDYAKFAGYHLGRPMPAYKRFRTVMLPWDNTARYGNRAIVHVNDEGDSYRLWLLQALMDTYRRHEPEERIVFLHSWNEWCEGTYLEPDQKRGRHFLEQTQRAVDIARQAIAAGGQAPVVEVASELVRMHRAKDEGAYQAVAATRLQVQYTWRDLMHEKDESARLRDRTNQMQTRIGHLEREVYRQADETAAAHTALEVLRSSTSWRMTAPLRRLVMRWRGR